MTVPARLLDLLEALPAEDVRQVTEALARYLDGGAESLADALRQRPDSLSVRNSLLCQARAKFFPHLAVEPAAEEIAKRWQRYEATGWRLDRVRDECPPHRQGRLEGFLWEMMRLRPHPLSTRQVRRILAISGAGNGQ